MLTSSVVPYHYVMNLASGFSAGGLGGKTPRPKFNAGFLSLNRLFVLCIARSNRNRAEVKFINWSQSRRFGFNWQVS